MLSVPKGNARSNNSLSVHGLTTEGNTCLVDWVKQGGAIGAEATLLGKVAGFVAGIVLIVVSVGSNSC